MTRASIITGLALLLLAATGAFAEEATDAPAPDTSRAAPRERMRPNLEPVPGTVIFRTGPAEGGIQLAPGIVTQPAFPTRGFPEDMRPEDGMSVIRGERALEAGDPETAQRIFRELWDRDVRVPRVAIGLGESLVQLTRGAELDSLAATLPREHAAYPYLRVLGGELLARAGRSDEAVARWRDAVSRVPREHRREALEVVGRFETDHALWSEAAKTFEEARAIAGTREAYGKELGTIHLAAGRADEAAAEFLALILAASPDRAYAETRLAAIHADHPELRKAALRRVRDELRRTPERIDLSDVAVRWGIAEGECDAALAEAMRREGVSSTGGGYLVVIADLARSSPCPDLAADAWREFNTMYASRPMSPAVQLALARLLESSGRKSEAADAYLRLGLESVRGRESAEALSRAADLLLALPGRGGEALDVLEILRDRYPGHPEGRRAPVRIAAALLASGRSDEASSALVNLLADTTEAGRSRTLEPRDEEEARYLHARLLYFRGEFDLARGELDRVVEVFPAGGTVNDCLDLLFLLDASSEAPEEFRRIAEADHLAYRGDFTGAAGVLDELTSKPGPAGLEAAWRRAGIARREGHGMDALALLERVQGAAEEPLRSRAFEEAAAIARDDLHDTARARRYYEAILTGDGGSAFADRARRALDALPGNLP